jgi:hypothetical protein
MSEIRFWFSEMLQYSKLKSNFVLNLGIVVFFHEEILQVGELFEYYSVFFKWVLNFYIKLPDWVHMILSNKGPTSLKWVSGSFPEYVEGGGLQDKTFLLLNTAVGVACLTSGWVLEVNFVEFWKSSTARFKMITRLCVATAKMAD